MKGCCLCSSLAGRRDHRGIEGGRGGGGISPSQPSAVRPREGPTTLKEERLLGQAFEGRKRRMIV